MYAQPNPRKVAWIRAELKKEDETEICYRQHAPAQVFYEEQMTQRKER